MVTLVDFAHRLKRQNHQCQKGGKLLLRDHDAKGTFGISLTSSLMLYFFQRGGGLLYRLVFPQQSVTKPHLEQVLAGPDQRYLDVKSAVMVQKSLYCLRIRSTLAGGNPRRRSPVIVGFRISTQILKKKCLSWRGPRKGERFFITLFFNADTFLQEKADSETGGNRRSALHRLAESQQC